MKVIAVVGNMDKQMARYIFANQKLNFLLCFGTLFLSLATNQIMIPDEMTKQPMIPIIKERYLRGYPA